MRLLLLLALLAGCGQPAAPLGLPSHLHFAVVEGGPDPAPVNITLENTGTCELEYAVTSATVDGAAWIGTGPDGSVAASSTALLSVVTSAGAEGLTPGTWTGTVTVEASCSLTGQPAVGSPADISINVTVEPATTQYAVTGAVSGLLGAGLVLEEQGTGDYVVMDANGAFGFAVEDNTAFDVVVSQQPISPTQTCTVTGGNGLVSGGPVSGVLVSCIAECVPDSFEPNDIDFDAATITPGFHSLSWCDDEDWYHVPLGAWQQLTVEATFDHDEGDIDLFGYDAYLWPITDSTGSGDTETVQFVTESGAANIHVAMTDQGEAPGNTYDLEISRDCVPDAFEPNNSPAAAAQVSLPQISLYHSLCSGDADWFEVDVGAGDLFDAIVQAELYEGTVSLELQDLAGNTLATGAPGGYLSYTSPTSQALRFGVILEADTGDLEGSGYFLDMFL